MSAAASKQSARTVREARHACGMALTYCAIIKDNLNELMLRADYAETHALDAGDVAKVARTIANELVQLAAMKRGL